MSTLHRFKLIAGSHSYVPKGKKERVYLTSGDPQNDTLTSDKKLDKLFKNKFMDLGPVNGPDAVPDTSPENETNVEDEASKLPRPPGRDITEEFAGATDKHLLVFSVDAPINKGGGCFAYVTTPEGHALDQLNEGGKGLSHSKMQDLIGRYSLPKAE